MNVFVCLVLCHLLFVLLGGLVFTAVEKPLEEELRAEVEELRHSFLQENPCVDEGRLSKLLQKALSVHDSDVAVLKADADERRYDFISSLCFVVATLTTMGSDSYTLKSDEAKLFCIFYCTLGIPLTLFILTRLSNLLLLPVVTHAPLNHLHFYWGLPYNRAALVHAVLLTVLVVTLLFLLPTFLIFAIEPDWSLLDALFFCFVTLSTVGQGGNSLGRSWGPAAKETLELLITSYLLVGLVVILTLKDTVLEVPQVRAMMRIFSGQKYGELEGIHLNELAVNEANCEEELQYTQSICTISSTSFKLMSPCPEIHTNSTTVTPETN
ncbi:potassium channel, subfamily K, member 7 [Amphiprion ocellaris]|uniref:potassium channel, subfamily K, member 7 n=1 Tax=Amphiprion ocellaris TaxID=80972 RepID=UPI0024111A1C|nr:potassium channel, subfamily K, member 7 [Amphiprion ocellaris]